MKYPVIVLTAAFLASAEEATKMSEAHQQRLRAVESEYRESDAQLATINARRDALIAEHNKTRKEACDAVKIPVEQCLTNSRTGAISKRPEPPKPEAKKDEAAKK